MAKKNEKISEFDEPKKEIETKEIKPEGLSSKLDRLEGMLEEGITSKKIKKLKEKSLALPWGMESKAKNAPKKGKILVFYAQTNRILKPVVAKVENDIVMIGKNIHNASMCFTYLWKGKIPCLIVPEWSLMPIGPKEYNEATEANSNQIPAKTIIRMIEAGENQMLKGQMSGKTWIFAGVGLLVVGYIMFGGA